ncbi:XRE family transcriptional regulator [Azospirillum sp. sgz302134]
MSKLGDIRALRGMSQAELAKRVGTSQSQVAKLETGRRPMSFNWAIRLASVLDVKPEALLTNAEQIAALAQIADASAGPHPDSPDASASATPQEFGAKEMMNVFTFATARRPTQGRFPMQTEPVGATPTPPGLKGVEGAYGLRVTDTRMAPRFTPRQILHVHPRRTPVPDIGVLVRLHDGTACVREWGGWTDEGDLLLRSYTPAEAITLPGDSVADVHVIVGLEEGL